MPHSILPPCLYPWIHRGLKRGFPNCVWEMPTGSVDPSLIEERPRLLLSFDDGPHPDYTPALLVALAQWRIRANFFLLGERVERWPQITRLIAEQGHHIGLHGYRHISFPQLSPADLHRSLQQTQRAIAQACDRIPADYRDVRPPNGFFLPQTLRYLRQWEYRPVMWSVVPEDWLCPPVSVVVDRIRRQAYPGALIVLHDGAFGGAQVVETIEQVVPQLLEDGFEFATLDP